MIVLTIPDLAPTPTVGPATGSMISVGPAAPCAKPPTTSGNAASTPTAALPAGQSSASPTSHPEAAPASQSGGRRVWLAIALIALLSLGMIAALVGSVLLIARSAGTPAIDSTSEAGFGLARFPTSAPLLAATVRPMATARPTAAPKPTAAPNAWSKVLLEDDFDDPRRSGLAEDTTDKATFAFTKGAYAFHLKAPRYIVWSPIEGTYGDAAVAVDTTLDSGPAESAVGIIFRYQDENNFYFFRVSGSGSYSLDLYEQNGRQALVDWTESPAIKGQGQINRLRIEAQGDRLRLFVNDTLLDEVSDDTFTEGALALAVNTFSEGDATFTFDNLVVRGRN